MLRTILVLFPALAFSMPVTATASDEARWGGSHQGYGQNELLQLETCLAEVEQLTQNRSCTILDAEECLAACDVAADSEDASRCRSACDDSGVAVCERWSGGQGFDQDVGQGLGKDVHPPVLPGVMP
ncbi:hypothetical protein SAMN02745121_09130, partial [Nannocystis exedens]